MNNGSSAAKDIERRPSFVYCGCPRYASPTRNAGESFPRAGGSGPHRYGSGRRYGTRAGIDARVGPSRCRKLNSGTCQSNSGKGSPFTFDGEHVLLRNAAISKYYSRMRAGIALAAQTMKRKNRLRVAHGEPPSQLKGRKLQILYTFLGRHNFPAYVYRAASIFNEPAIKREIRHHPAKLARGIARLESRAPASQVWLFSHPPSRALDQHAAKRVPPRIPM